MSRDATEKEIAWGKKLSRLMKQKPKTIYLFANGTLSALCAKEVSQINSLKGESMPQPIWGMPDLGQCDGGDF